jgi:hypothetical protein
VHYSTSIITLVQNNRDGHRVCTICTYSIPIMGLGRNKGENSRETLPSRDYITKLKQQQSFNFRLRTVYSSSTRVQRFNF